MPQLKINAATVTMYRMAASSRPLGCSAITKSAFGSMSLNNNHPVNNEGQGSSSGSGNWTEDEGKDKGFGFLGASYEHSDQVKDRKSDG